MLFGFENGKVSKIFMKSYKTETQRKRLKNAYNNNSKIVYVDPIKEDVELVSISSIKKVLIFNTAQVSPKESRNSQGNQVMKSKNNSIMRKIKKVNQVSFQNIEYYRKNIPAIGNYLLSGDIILRLSHIEIILSFLQSFMQESYQFPQEIPAKNVRE